MTNIIILEDFEKNIWRLCVPKCHPAIFAKGISFVNRASADERAQVVMNAALEYGLDPSERGAWKQLWSEVVSGERKSSNVERLGLDFVFSGQKFAYLPFALSDSVGGGGSGESKK